ncbi:MAG: hypothetical protein FWD33_02400 [Alphaproteobacteria bacterium]|nr:hypothetical protein [Alphaproteobacteria bacterium]
MKLKEKRHSIAKEIGLKSRPVAAARPKVAKMVVINKTEKSLATIGNEFVNIGMYVGGRRFLRIWAALSIVFAVVVAVLYPMAWVAGKAEFYPAIGDKLYFWIVGGISTIPRIFMVAFIPMMFLVISMHYMFVNWRLPAAARPKMPRVVKQSLISSMIVGAVFGLLGCVFIFKIIPNTLLVGISMMNLLIATLYITAGLFVALVAVLSLYKELTYMLSGSRE